MSASSKRQASSGITARPERGVAPVAVHEGGPSSARLEDARGKGGGVPEGCGATSSGTEPSGSDASRGISVWSVLVVLVVVTALIGVAMRQCPEAPVEPSSPVIPASSAAACSGWPDAFLTRADVQRRFDQPGWNALLMAQEPLQILEELEADGRETPESRALRLRSLVLVGLGLERAYTASRIAAAAFLDKRLEVGVPGVAGAEVYAFYRALLEIEVGASGEPYLSRIPAVSPLQPAVAVAREIGRQPVSATGPLSGLQRYALHAKRLAAVLPEGACPFPGVARERLTLLAALYASQTLPPVTELRERLRLSEPDVLALSCLEARDAWRATPLFDPALYGMLAVTALRQAVALSPGSSWERVWQVAASRRLSIEQGRAQACELRSQLTQAPSGDEALPALLFGPFVNEASLLKQVGAWCEGEAEPAPTAAGEVLERLERAQAYEEACLSSLREKDRALADEAQRMALYGAAARWQYLEPVMEGRSESLSLARLAFEHWDGATLPATLWDSREVRLAWISADVASREYDMAPRQALSLSSAEPLYRPLSEWMLLAQSAVAPNLDERRLSAP